MAHSCLHPLLLAQAEPLEGPEESSNLEQEESLSITGSKHHILGEGTETCPKVHRISVSLLGSESDVPTSTVAHLFYSVMKISLKLDCLSPDSSY